MADDKILASISDLSKSLCDLFALAKNPISFESLKQISALLNDLRNLAADVQGATPQLSGLTIAEDGEILAAIYQGVINVIAAAAK